MPRQAFSAVDGDLGEYVRKEIAAKGMYAIPHPFDNGFRQITANKPVRNASELEGLKIRVPASPASVDLFKTLGAAPAAMNVSELYTSLQTHVVDAQENALINIEQSRVFEVQKTLNFSNHSWTCWWFLVNQDAWNALGPEIQGVVTRNVAKYADLQRRDFASLTASLTDKLHRQGRSFRRGRRFRQDSLFCRGSRPDRILLITAHRTSRTSRRLFRCVRLCSRTPRR